MKYDVTRSCGHIERVKVYDAFPFKPKESERHTKLVLLTEHYRICRQCGGK